ncbi:MAG TPA: TetR/AcrR family transcriptional regulator C-terminal domain-containing protein [Caulobacteraceae bacterium]
MAELDAGRIAAAALAVADARGLAGFTMRAVAEALAVTPMALYHHVKDKAALAALVVDAAIGEQPLPAPTGDWREDLWAMARWTRESRRAHPALAHIRRAYGVWTQASLQMTERWLSLWQQSGLPLAAALTAARTSSLAVVGLVEEEAAFRGLDRPADAALAWLPNARLMFDAPPDYDADFELLSRALIAGLHARLSAG